MERHFIQRCAGPVFIGPGNDALRCACGRVLIEGYDPARFRAVGLECGQCGTLTMTPPLPPGAAPAPAVIVAEPVAEARTETTTLPANIYVVGRAEMDRIVALYLPVDPKRSIYAFTPSLLEEVASLYQHHAGVALPLTPQDAGHAFTGIRRHALGWAVGHLRHRMAAGPWSVADRAETSAATTLCAGFLHFVASWGHHPLFPAMLARAGEAGFSLHGLAPFAAAYALSMQGNRVSFPRPVDGEVDQFSLATGPLATVPVRTVVFDRFEHPFGIAAHKAGDPASLRSAVSDSVAAEQGRINLRKPGVLLLSPGIALAGFDADLIRAVQHVMSQIGRRNRGLLAVGIIVLRMMPEPDPHAVRFGYGLFPVSNRHAQAEALVLAANPEGAAAGPAS